MPPAQDQKTEPKPKSRFLAQKIEPKPTDLSQYETVTTLVLTALTCDYLTALVVLAGTTTVRCPPHLHGLALPKGQMTTKKLVAIG